MPRFLFICCQARLRSPAAVAVFADCPNIDTECAGLNNDADTPLDSEMLDWADYIIVMEKAHRSRLLKKFKPWLDGKRIVVLGIPDDYEYMQPELVNLLRARVPRLVRIG